MRKVLILFAFVAVFLAMPGGSVGSAPQSPYPGLLTYWEAKAAGLRVPPLPEQTGVRACTEEDYGPGFTSPEEAARALEEYEARWGETGPDYCQVDPRTALYGLEFPAGRTSIFEQPESESSQRASMFELEEEQEESEGEGEGGEETGEVETGGTAACLPDDPSIYRRVRVAHCTINIEGVRGQIEVGNPPLCHSNCTVAKQVYGNVVVGTQGGHAMEIGWFEGTGITAGDVQIPVVGFNDAPTFFGPPSTDFASGSFPYFRVRHNGPGGGPGDVRAEWFDGAWHLADVQSGIWCMDANGAGNCRAGQSTEIAAANQGWFNLNAPTNGAGINNSATMLRTNPNVWKLFSPANFSEGGSRSAAPYSKCNYFRWHQFRVPRGGCG